MHRLHALVAALLLLPALPATALAPPVAAVEVLPLEFQAPLWPAELVVGVPVALPLGLATSGLAGTGTQPPLERRADLQAMLDSGDPATLEPAIAVFPPGEATATATLRFTPTRLGPLAISLHAAWQAFPGNASLSVQRTVVKDDLSVDALEAGSPDADLDLRLQAALRSGHLEAEPLAWRVDAQHTPLNGTESLTWVAAEGTGLAGTEGLDWDATVRARYGPGLYRFVLSAEGDRLEQATSFLDVTVPEVRRDTKEVNFTLEVEDHPTTLRLASDSVNADGKAKAPGSALITRVVVGDLNGLGDVRRVTFTYHRDDQGTLVPVDAVVLQGFDPALLQQTLEDRFERAPLKDGAYVCVVTAEGTGVAVVSRTFVITDASPAANVTLGAPSVFPARTSVVHGNLTLLDANFGTGPLDASDIHALGTFQVILYKGSKRVDEAGWALTAGPVSGAPPLTLNLSGEGTRTTGYAYQVVGGKGALVLPLEVTVPPGATPGTYRVSVAAASSLASVNLEVEALPRVTRLAFTGSAPPGGLLPFEADIQPAAGLAAAELRLPWATLRAESATLAPIAGGLRWTGNLTLPSPLDDDAAHVATLLADLGDGSVVVDPAGAAVNARSAPVPAANVPPTVQALLRVGGASVGQEAWLHPNAARELTADVTVSDANALAPDLADEVVSLTAEVRDWKGAPARFRVTGERSLPVSRLAVEPDGAEPGRYTLQLKARDDDGVETRRELVVNVGTQFRLDLLDVGEGLVFAAGPDGRLQAALRLRNGGNAPAMSLAVLAEGLPAGAQAEAELRLANGTVLRAPLVQGFARFESPRLLDPAQDAELRVLVRVDAGVPAGLFRGRMLVAGEAA